MVDNLYRQTMAYSGEVPWHRKGEGFTTLMTSDQAIRGAKLDYEVVKERLYREDGSPTTAHVTINKFNNEILGYVSAKYSIIQNVRAFDFFDEFVGQGLAMYVTAGALGVGEKMWLLAKLPSSFSPLHGDTTELYCLLVNTHDGERPLCVCFTPIRVVCQNTLNMALANCQNVVKIRHTLNAEERMREAGRIMKLMDEHFKRLGDTAEKLARFEIDDDFIKEYQNALFGKNEDLPELGPSRSIRWDKIRMYEGRLYNGMGVDIPGVKGTAWWCLNAGVEMADYDMTKNDADPTERVIFGNSAKFKQSALDTVLELVKVRS